MKVTLEVPTELFRRVSTQAAAEGRTVGEVTVEAYEVYLAQSASAPAAVAADERRDRGSAWLARWDDIIRRANTDPADPRSIPRILMGVRGARDG